MKLRMFFAFAATAACAFATDGQILINESTVMAAGGFPYTISQPGSYKLSGDLVATTGKQAILISANNVVLDLNGFNISCTLGQPPSVNGVCVGDSGADPGHAFPLLVSHVSVRNGTVTLLQTQGSPGLAGPFNFGVGFFGSTYIVIQDLHIETSVSGTNGFNPFNLAIGRYSIIWHNLFEGVGQAALFDCPSLIEANVTSNPGAGIPQQCTSVNNVGF
jgi:hypothetical protein